MGVFNDIIMYSDWSVKDPINHFLWLESNLLICYHPLSMSLTRPIRHWNWHSITGNIWRRLLLCWDPRRNWAPTPDHLLTVWPTLIRALTEPGRADSAHSGPTFNLLQGRKVVANVVHIKRSLVKWHKMFVFKFFSCAFYACSCCCIILAFTFAGPEMFICAVDYCFVLRMYA